WPEAVVRVQSLSDSGVKRIPECYVKPIDDRPSLLIDDDDSSNQSNSNSNINIPVIDLGGVYSEDNRVRKRSMEMVSEACREWGLFQVVNHGVREELMEAARRVWREFFSLPMEMKQEYANTPETYEGYGSRVGVEKGAKLDWSDYFFLHFLPLSLRNPSKWPANPHSCRSLYIYFLYLPAQLINVIEIYIKALVAIDDRELVREYNEEVLKVCGKLMKILSVNLGLEEDYLENAFGGDQIGTSLRVNFYPKCPQPDLTLGISPHSDPGGLTVLLPDDHVSGLQVRKDDVWLTVKPIPNAFIINLADQLQVVSNAQYKSVEHRVIVSSNHDRVSLAFFYNPRGDILIEPAKQLLLTNNEAPLYQPMTFNDYRTFIRLNGLHGKSQVDSLKSPP
ncbi:hypothetical protein M8C21_025916, partial [Ambrosia artemisiifolia]